MYIVGMCSSRPLGDHYRIVKHTHTSGLEAWNDMPIFDRCCSTVTRPTELVSLESPLICATYVDVVHLVHIVILR